MSLRESRVTVKGGILGPLSAKDVQALIQLLKHFETEPKIIAENYSEEFLKSIDRAKDYLEAVYTQETTVGSLPTGV